LESKDPDKRDKLVDKLITTADGECHFQLLRRSRRLCVALGHHRGRVRRRGPRGHIGRSGGSCGQRFIICSSGF
jgi:hypothetical protein